jgi:hypothetical protein
MILAAWLTACIHKADNDLDLIARLTHAAGSADLAVSKIAMHMLPMTQFIMQAASWILAKQQ